MQSRHTTNSSVMSSTPSTPPTSPTPRLGKLNDEDGFTQDTRFWPQFRLSTLLLIILVGSVPLAYWGVQRMRTRVQTEVLDRMSPWGPTAGWFEGNVVQVTFRGDRFAPEVAQHLSQLPHLKRLVLINTTIDMDGLNQLAALPLEELQIHQATNLRLEGKAADEMAIDKTAQPALDKLARAREGTANTKSNAETKALRFPPTLTSLGLEYTKLDDRFVASLTPLRQLRSLSLTGTSVGDGCVMDLAKLTQLESITLRKTALTEDGIELLKRELPQAYVHWVAWRPEQESN